MTAREMEKPIRLPPTEMWKFSFSLSLVASNRNRKLIIFLRSVCRLCRSSAPLTSTAPTLFFPSFRPYFPMIKRTEKKTKDRKETKKKWKTKKKRNNLSGGGFNGEKKKKSKFFFFFPSSCSFP